jgi:hypothetical protein
MKRIIFFLIGTFFFSEAFPQTNTYYPLPSDSTYWREWTGGFQSGFCSDYQYFISGDTTINGLLYRKISKMGVVYYEDTYGYCTNTIAYYYTVEYYGAYRNDSTNKKVYGMFTYFENDTLLYDFNLNLGDTLKPSALNNPVYGILVVSGIDSILIGNQYHKRYAISYSNWPNSHVSLIEGIGSTYGLFGKLTPHGQQGTILNCVVEGGQTVYNSTGFPCDLFTNVSNIVPENFHFILSPNPVNEFTTLECNCTDKNLDFTIFDIYGQQVYQFRNIINGVKINTSALNCGIYIYTVSGSNGMIKISKLLKVN